jgi:hypothetical protein
VSLSVSNEALERNPLKDEYVEIAARAEYEAMRASVVDLENTTWDTLPEHEGQLPTPRCKQYYRDHVSTAVEALWRAGKFYEPRRIAEDYVDGLRAEPGWSPGVPNHIHTFGGQYPKAGSNAQTTCDFPGCTMTLGKFTSRA